LSSHNPHDNENLSELDNLVVKLYKEMTQLEQVKVAAPLKAEERRDFSRPHLINLCLLQFLLQSFMRRL